MARSARRKAAKATLAAWATGGAITCTKKSADALLRVPARVLYACSTSVAPLPAVPASRRRGLHKRGLKAPNGHSATMSDNMGTGHAETDTQRRWATTCKLNGNFPKHPYGVLAVSDASCCLTRGKGGV